MDAQELGRLGEEEAVKWLAYKNIEILARNWRFGQTELDIIGRDEVRIIFFEVKARSSAWYSLPEDSVNLIKRKSMIKAANAWCDKNGYEGAVRFDVISILFTKSGKRLVHIPDAFFPLSSDL